MRLIVRAALGALACSVFTAAGAFAQSASPGTLKIAYINSQKIIAEAPGRAEAEGQIQKEMDAYRAEVQKLSDSLNTMVSAYTKAEPTLSPAAKQGKQKEIQTKQNEYQQRVQELEQKAQQRQAELIRPIMQKIDQIIDQIRVEEGYAIVLDAGSQSGVVVSADSSLDITQKVIDRLKSAGPVSSTPKPKPSAGPTIKPTGPSRPQSPLER
jgi:outer membrane protein